MTSLLRIDNLDIAGDNTEHLDKLFPRCRPRDINLNSVLNKKTTQDDNNHNNMMDTESDRCVARSRECCEEGDPVDDEGNCEENEEEEEEEDEDDEDSFADEMNDDEDLVIDHTQDDSSNDVIVVSSGHKGQSYKIREPTEPSNDMLLLSGGKGGTYKLRDSRIIEIAGGREMFSHSRSKGSRKSRYNDETDKIGSKRNKMQGVWELRSRNGEPKKPRNANEVTETVFSTEVHSVCHARNTHSPEGAVQLEVVPQEASSAVTRGEVVVFDDIGDDWRGMRLDLQGAGGKEEDREGDSSDGSSPSPPTYHRNAADFFKAVTSGDLDGDSISPDHSSKVGRVIGNLPIADYEGSPRRYGPRQLDVTQPHPVLPSAQSLLASPSVYPPRPGFPQRVLPTPTEDLEPLSTSPSLAGGTFDYLYEFSETRKVLEEFFKCPASSEEVSTDFHELDYELRRQAGAGSSYVGQRLAKGTPGEVEESPRKPNGDGHLLDLSADDTGSTEDTEIGLQVGHSRNFTLSPETTDCDSNCGDLDSEASLMEGEGACQGNVGETLGVVPDSLRVYSGMPVLEDGLSSGHASDTDNNNPTVLLIKRQITEIEREFVRRKTSPEKQVDVLEKMFSLGKSNENSYDTTDIELEALDPLVGVTPPPPAPQPHRSITLDAQSLGLSDSVEAAIKDIRLALQRTKPLKSPTNESPEQTNSPVWIPRRGDKEEGGEDEADTDLETDRLLGQQRTDDHGFFEDKLEKDGNNKKKGRNKEVMIHEPAVLIEGVLFRAHYLGSTQLVCEGQPTKSTRMMQAEEAVSRIKAPEGETQPSTEVDLFISTEKIMVLNTDLKEIMMDHALRTISYIADIGDLVVLMARRRFVPHDADEPPKINRTPKMICHVFESEEAQFIAQSIGQAFQVAYMEFLKANGIEDHSFVKEMDYQEVLNSQEIFGDELQMFAKKEMQKEVVVPKAKGEILGVVIVESGWGSMLPTVVIANLAPVGAAARCGQLNIGDQIIAINGVSLVGLPLSTCQNYIKNTKNQTVVKLTVVPCAPVVEVKIKRPDTKYQLGFSVQNGVICSLLRGGIAERGGVRVGHRIIEINNQSVVAVPHEKIVNLLATSVGEFPTEHPGDTKDSRRRMFVRTFLATLVSSQKPTHNCITEELQLDLRGQKCMLSAMWCADLVDGSTSSHGHVWLKKYLRVACEGGNSGVPMHHQEPQWEGKCATVNMTMKQFMEETAVPSSQRERWLYFDYKHMNEWFKDNPAILEAVNWKNLGFPERQGSDSTLWIGSEGAHTPCHFDTYGCNLVAQILGRKQWILVPPEETASMLPTRIPYEESSVYSSWNFTHPESSIATVVNGIRVVTLNPGDVLFVPRHWWHYVESMETAISVNTWIPVPGDEVCRLEESLVRLFISEICKDVSNPRSFLNPNEMDLIDCPLLVSSSLVQNSLSECGQASSRCDAKGDGSVTTVEGKASPFVDEYSGFVSVVPQCTRAQVLDVFARKCLLNTTGVTTQAPDESNEHLLKKVINAFCQPDVISLVRQKIQM